MADWNEVTITALRDLGADSVMVPGAKLRHRMVQLGYSHSFDVAAHVSLSTLSFSQLVAQVSGVVVQAQPGGDVLVGLGDARAPSESTAARRLDQRTSLRRDVYEAFTRLSNVPFAYMPESDRFVPESQAHGTSVGVSPVSLETLLADRRQFIQSLPADRQGPLLDAVNGSTTPLAAFRNALTTAGIFKTWATAQTQLVARRVRQWASENGVTPRDAWFRSDSRTTSPHQALARLIPHLTTDEIRNLSIPFRAVEALLSDISD